MPEVELEPENKETTVKYSKKIQQIEKELERHIALYPGEYRIYESCNSKHNNDYRAWIRKKLEMSEFISIHRLINSNKNPICDVETEPELPERLKTKLENPIDSYYKSYLESLEFLGIEEPNTRVWKNERGRASNLRNKIIGKCRQDGVPLPKPLPKLPKAPRFPCPMSSKKD